jgi:hypothetical protein
VADKASDEKVYLPKMKTRPGFTHSYQGKNVVVVDENGPVKDQGGKTTVISTSTRGR